MKIFKLFFLLFLIGCASSKGPDLVQLQKDYETVVFDDGITLEEAVLIAKKEVTDKTGPEMYLIDQPKVVTEFESVPHNKDFWFITFRETEGGMTTVVYMVVLNKETGKIVLSRSYYPENEYLLEATLLKLYEKPKK